MLLCHIEAQCSGRGCARGEGGKMNWRIAKTGNCCSFPKSWVLLFAQALVGHDDLCGQDVGDVTIPCAATRVSTMNW